MITKTAYEQEIPLSVQSSRQFNLHPDDWFNDKRVSNRKKISELAFEKSEIQDLDLPKQDDREEFLK